MGTKGRDILIWFSFMAIILSSALSLLGYSMAGRLFIFISVLSTLLIMWHLSKGMLRAEKNSARMGLNIVMLMPVYKWLALGFVMGKIKGNIKKAYEIHFRTDVVKNSLNEYLQVLDRDLVMLSESTSMLGALVMWESHIPVPSRFRRLIRTKEAEKEAFYVKGGWGIPYPPFVNPMLKKNKSRVYHGAFLNN